jgi:hypothetical protein
LPTWDRAAAEAKLAAARIAPISRSVVETYLAAPSEKVLAVSQSSRRAFWWAGGDLVSMRQKSREACEQKTGETCAIVMENFEMVGRDVHASIN